MNPGDNPIQPALLLRDGSGERLVSTLEEALVFIRQHEEAERAGNRDATIFRLESARTAEEKATAADGFRAWAEAAGLLIEARTA